MLKSSLLLICSLAFASIGWGQDGFCCDIDSYDFFGGVFQCQESGSYMDFQGNGEVCDLDCADFSCQSLGCTDEGACNYDADATLDDGSCEQLDCAGICGGDALLDECGVCGGEGIAEGACDCEGNVLDECDVCGGEGIAGIADGACDCDGNVLDECGVCGGDGIAEGACDCDGNVLDECGVCGGDGIAGIADGACDCDGNVLDECGVCGGDGIAEGACDCDGNVLDECGVCGGEGIADGACDCDGNVLDECGVCGGEGIADGACDCDGNVLDECGVCGGDGIAEGECNCDGDVEDECGVCGGDGIPAGDCDCDDIPAGGCDCEGNVLDECGVCGGEGIADGACDCDGNVLDECGVCNGPGEIYECGCADIPEDDCDCDGNQLDVLGECGGNCPTDEDADGICDDVDDCVGAYDACGICNGPGAVFECGCEGIPESDYTLTVESAPAVGDGGTVYRFYVDMQDATDRMIGVFGNDQANLIVNAPDGVFNSAINSGWSAAGINPFFLLVLPDLADDSYATIGLEGPASNVPGAEDPSLFEDENQPISPFFLTPGATALESNTLTGASWYVSNGASNGLPDADGRVLVMQVTTSGAISGQLNLQILQLGLAENFVQASIGFEGAGTFYGYGTCLLFGCQNPSACNYDIEANTDDGSCVLPEEGYCDCDGNVFDECGVCGGDGIAEGDCDCDGNVLDECGICGGDGIEGIADGACDCDGNVLDECGVCGGTSVPGCNDPNACNFSPLADCDVTCEYVDCPTFGCLDQSACNYASEADFEDGSCEYLTCGGCMIAMACNYDEEALFNDGSCDFLSCLVFGCNDPSACNWDEDVQFNDGSCSYANFPYGCDGECLEDSDGDGICDPLELLGCTDPLACNFASAATSDDESCLYGCAGCTNSLACNFNPGATADDGSCDFASCNGVGCNDAGACNYNAEALVDDGSCVFPEEGDCDCEGNQLDAAGECGGTCIADNNANGICDDAEVLGCLVDNALNFDAAANVDDGSCLFATDLPENLAYVATPASGLLLGTVLLDNEPVTEPALLAAFNTQGLCVGWNPVIGIDGVTVVALAVYGDDLSSTAVEGLQPNEAFNLGLYLVESDTLVPYTLQGSEVALEGWMNTNGTPLPDYADVQEIYNFYLITECNLPEACNYNVSASSDIDCVFAPVGLNCDGSCLSDADGDGVCDGDEIEGCTDESACNFTPLATENDFSCLSLDECGVCGGDGIAEGACNCDGESLDATGVCGGTCPADADADGLCDDVDDCVGAFDACGVCNGPGDVYTCGCAEIPAEDCDCEGNQLDILGVCGGDCAADEDADGICDDVDPCVGALDACGICNGPGAIYACGCSDIPEEDCDCEGNQLDALGLCGGDCVTDADADGICDDVDDCVGELDACGVCNGPGEIYECGCADIPEDDCDCDGNQLDALGVCGGDCATDADADGVCDDVDDCVGELDACGICNGPGEIYECGCEDIPEGDCDCEGTQLDALGACGGDCAADADADGICDDVDDCVGEVDAIGVCNGTCEADEDQDGVCDSEEVLGCDDPDALNYMPEATENDGNCNYETATPQGFESIPTSNSATVFGYVTIDGLSATGMDWIAAFSSSGVCSGATSLYMFEGQAYINLTVYGDDATTLDLEEGILPDGAFSLAFFDQSTGTTLPYQNGLVVQGWFNTNGAPLPGFNNPQSEYAFVYPRCGDTEACNFDPLSLTNDACVYPDNFENCEGNCINDEDADGLCDEVDDCIGPFDACGICNGPGDIYQCGCADIPEGDCDCDGNQLDILGVCGGDCAADADADGICDDVDPCVGSFDACGVCNGPGDIYQCGCADIPEGDCDCDGNQLDAIGVCGGDCEADGNNNGLCDADECLADMNNDGMVQLNDLLDLLQQYGQSCQDCPEDLNFDGLIQLNDLLNLLTAYGTSCAP